MRLTEAAERVFARHETFHPRYGWFRKAYAFVGKDPKVFVSPDAPVHMGVGKNMVRAIRFWGTAAKLIESPDGRPASEMTRTDEGDRLFGEDGWDPYMEDPATLWLLHWWLLAPPCWLPVWWVAFNQFHAVEFSDEQLESVVLAQLELAVEWKTPHRSSIRKDVSALLRTYMPTDGTGRGMIDDLLNCPLRELGLIKRSAATNQYRFATGAKPALPAAVVAYASLDYVERTKQGGNTVTVSRLAREPGGPGRAFRMSEDDLRDALASVAEDNGKIEVATVASAPQLSWHGSARHVSNSILDDHYGRPTEGVTTTGAPS